MQAMACLHFNTTFLTALVQFSWEAVNVGFSPEVVVSREQPKRWFAKNATNNQLKGKRERKILGGRQ